NMYKRMNRRLKKIIFVSDAVRKGVESREGCVGDKGIVIPNGVDILEGPFKEGLLPEEIDIIRDRYGVPPGRKLVVTLSRLVPEKGLDCLLEAAVELRKAGRDDFYILVAGDGPLRIELEAKARKLYVNDMVRFAGYIKDVRSLLSASDMFVLCSHAEPFGIAVLEAMSVGVPVIVASAGGPLEIIREGESGLFFRPGDAKGLSDKILKVADDRLLWNELVRGARNRVMDYDEKIVAESIMKVYDEVSK
ncbi:MAG TPA: glycosyltransferase family 4 protein, partial [bacterium]|nr:glycosyltransferase family 4 protein [bacterium]